jgi:hypothetical protein
MELPMRIRYLQNKQVVESHDYPNVKEGYHALHRELQYPALHGARIEASLYPPHSRLDSLVYVPDGGTWRELGPLGTEEWDEITVVEVKL